MAVAEPKPTLEELVEPRFNDADFYGFSGDVLTPFLATGGTEKPGIGLLNGHGLTHMLQGINNFESYDGKYGAGHEILRRMNTYEIAALYIGINSAKKRTLKRDLLNTYHELLEAGPEAFPEMVSFLVRIGFGYNGIGVMKRSHKGFADLSDGENDLKARMRTVGDFDAQRFYRSLQTSYRMYGEATAELPRHFPDPYLESSRNLTRTDKIKLVARIVRDVRELFYHNKRQMPREQLSLFDRRLDVPTTDRIQPV